MTTVADSTWAELDQTTRAEFDRQYRAELRALGDRGLTDEAIRAYLDYRHERPGASLTTYEEGHVRQLLRRFSVPLPDPDPALDQEHIGRLEQFGAERLHVTNERLYVIVMVGLTLAFVAVLLLVAIRL